MFHSSAYYLAPLFGLLINTGGIVGIIVTIVALALFFLVVLPWRSPEIATDGYVRSVIIGLVTLFVICLPLACVKSIGQNSTDASNNNKESQFEILDEQYNNCQSDHDRKGCQLLQKSLQQLNEKPPKTSYSFTLRTENKPSR